MWMSRSVRVTTWPLVWVALLVTAQLLAVAVATSSTTSPLDVYFNRRVLELDDDNFAQVTSKQNAVTLVTFYTRIACPRCRELRDAVNRAAQDLYGQAVFAGVDIKDPHAATVSEKFGLTSTAHVPVVRAFPSAAALAGKVAPSEDKGDVVELKFPVTAAALKDSVTAIVTKRAKVEEVTGKSLKAFLQSKANPKLAKALLISSKREVPAVWQAMSVQFAGRLAFGFAQKSDRALMRATRVKDVPAILVYPPPMLASEKPEEVEPVLFTGPTKAPNIRAFLSPFTSSAADDESSPLPQFEGLPHLADASCMTAHCTALGGLCAVLVVPEQSRRDTLLQLEVLAAVHDARTDASVHFGYVFAKDEPAMMKRWRLNPEAYPQLIVMEPRSKKFSAYIGSYQMEDLTAWLGDVVRGTVVASSMDDIANPSDPLPPLQGKGPTGDGQSCAAKVERAKEKAARRAAALEEEKRKLQAESSSGSRPAAQQQQQQQQQNSSTNPFDASAAGASGEMWIRPHRPAGKWGFPLPVEDRTIQRLVVERNTPALVRFAADPKSLDLSVPAEAEALAKEKATAEEFDRTGKGLNNMIRFFTAQCGDKASTGLFEKFLLPKARQAAWAAGDNNANPKIKCGGQILVFPPQSTLEAQGKARDKDYYLYDGPMDTKGMTATVLKLIDDGEVRVVTKDTFQKWVVENIMMPRVLILTTKKEPPALAKALATEFHGYIGVGITHESERELMAQMQAERAPAVRIIKPSLVPKAGDKNAHELTLEMTKFVDNALYFNAIAQMLDNFATTKFGSGPSVVEETAASATGGGPAQFGAKVQPGQSPADASSASSASGAGSGAGAGKPGDAVDGSSGSLSEAERAELLKSINDMKQAKQAGGAAAPSADGKDVKEEL